jgi:hypothetical protein
MLSKTRGMPVKSPAPGVIPGTITGPVGDGEAVARDADAAPGQPTAQRAPGGRTRRDAATARDRLDAERWLDEGGSFNSETVTR